MAYLFDTNIFLEIFLDQDKKDKAKKFISDNIKELFISDFSLHSIGIILLKHKKSGTYEKFLNDILPYVTVLNLPMIKYNDLIDLAKNYNMDFDDSYQTLIAKENDLDILTMDNDFKKIKSFVKVKFI